MKNPPAGERPLHQQLDVPQDVRLRASGLHQLAARLHTGLGQHWAPAAVLENAEEQLVEMAERALALRAALVQERKRLAGRA